MVPRLIEVHLYGSLRQYGDLADPTLECVVRVQVDADHVTVGGLLGSLGIPPQDVASVFIDGRWEREGVRATLRDARRLGLFPRKMGLLYV